MEGWAAGGLGSWGGWLSEGLVGVDSRLKPAFLDHSADFRSVPDSRGTLDHASQKL